MALIFEGTTKCALCNTVLSKDDDYMVYPHITSNTLEPLYTISDVQYIMIVLIHMN